MDFFLIRYLIRSFSRIKKLAGRIEEIYKTNDKFGRHSVCVFAIAAAVLNLLLTIVGNLLTGQLSEGGSSLMIYLIINIIVIAALIVDERKLKEYKTKKGMSDKEEAFLRAIALEKGVNPITFESIKSENIAEGSENSVKPEQAAVQKPAPVQQKAAPKKESISDYLSADEIAEMEQQQKQKKENE